jgi:hypothetical protein
MRSKTPWEKGAKALSFFLLPSTPFFLPPPHLLASLEVFQLASFEALLCFIRSIIHLFRSLIPQSTPVFHHLYYVYRWQRQINTRVGKGAYP